MLLQIRLHGKQLGVHNLRVVANFNLQPRAGSDLSPNLRGVINMVASELIRSVLKCLSC